jgi:hypothetical protein
MALVLGRALAVAALLVAAPLATVPSALADCASSVPVENAVQLGPVVFVGTVTFVENDNRWAVVQVDERWLGADELPPSVNVHGGPEEGSSTPTDRAYQVAQQYLFVVTNQGDSFADDACSGTTPWTPDLARLRPAGVTAVAPGDTGTPLDLLSNGSTVAVAALFGALLVAIVAYILILRRRRRPPDWMR